MTLTIRTSLALALTALALGACTARDEVRSSSGGARYASLDAIADGRRHSARATAPARPATPVVVLPDWIGRPVRLQERDAADEFEQSVSLSLAPRGGTRENLVLLRMSHTEAGAEVVSGDLVPGGRPTEAGIRAELVAAFPGTVMHVVPHPAANAYGPYGLAVGRTAGGARCLYAWQWIAAAPELDPASRGSASLSLRVRLCRDDIPLDAMAAAVNQIKLVTRYEGSPVIGTPAPRAPSAARRHARPRTVVGSPDPTPAGTAGQAATLPAGRRYLGIPDAAATPDDGQALRDAGPGPAALSRAFVGAQPPAPAEAIVADLPPEALRGPVARAAARP
ncbi:cellulose biosynthesis protein BcsN [Methylobacterium sp. GC_Met_2]|uniref:cellulose biosynthesis protein BcsN n=1 Tax=Methylobacterium sp. GC_Met_2 TaxID=2937376 RepID=UPI00226B2DEE